MVLTVVSLLHDRRLVVDLNEVLVVMDYLQTAVNTQQKSLLTREARSRRLYDIKT